MYGLSKDGYIFVFRTSNLLIQPDATECRLDTKFKVLDSGKSITTVRGGILVESDHEKVYLNASTFMLQRHSVISEY